MEGLWQQGKLWLCSADFILDGASALLNILVVGIEDLDLPSRPASLVEAWYIRRGRTYTPWRTLQQFPGKIEKMYNSMLSNHAVM